MINLVTIFRRSRPLMRPEWSPRTYFLLTRVDVCYGELLEEPLSGYAGKMNQRVSPGVVVSSTATAPTGTTTNAFCAVTDSLHGGCI